MLPRVQDEDKLTLFPCPLFHPAPSPLALFISNQPPNETSCISSRAKGTEPRELHIPGARTLEQSLCIVMSLPTAQGPLVLKAPIATPVLLPPRSLARMVMESRRLHAPCNPSFPLALSGVLQIPFCGQRQSRKGTHFRVAHNQGAAEQAYQQESHGDEVKAPDGGSAMEGEVRARS